MLSKLPRGAKYYQDNSGTYYAKVPDGKDDYIWYKQIGAEWEEHTIKDTVPLERIDIKNPPPPPWIEKERKKEEKRRESSGYSLM
jgi:hypothetical protein